MKSLWKWAILAIAVISVVPFVGSQAQQQTGWQQPVVVASAGFAANNLVHNPDLAFDSSTGTLYVAYSDTRGDADIQLRSSTDGVNWTDPVSVSNTPGISLQPSVAARNGKVCVAWNEIVADTELYAVYVACSTDGGKTFGAAQDVSNAPNDDAGKAEFVDSVADGSLGIAIDDQGVVHVAWTFYVEPKYSQLAVGAEKFSDPISLPYEPSAAIGFPTFGVAPNGDLYLAWADRSSSSADIFVIRSPAGANRTDPASWQGPFNATANSGFSDGPWIAFQDGKIFIVNDESTTNPDFADINLTVSSDNGQSWTGTRAIAKDGAFPSIASDGKTLYVAFETRGGTLGFVCSTDSGENWKRDDVDTKLVGEKRFQGVRNVDQRGIATDASGNVYVTYVTRPESNKSNIIVQKRVGC